MLEVYTPLIRQIVSVVNEVVSVARKKISTHSACNTYDSHLEQTLGMFLVYGSLGMT